MIHHRISLTEQALHSLHHELCHVDDENKKIDGMPGVMLRERLNGKRAYTYRTAIGCWSEYRACFLSAPTIPEPAIDNYIDAVVKAQEQADHARNVVAGFPTHRDLDQVLGAVVNAGDLLSRISAYLFGTLDALGRDISDTGALAALRDAGIEGDAGTLHEALRSMQAGYPGAWTDLRVYADLADAIEDLYFTLGARLSDTHEGVWLEVGPF